MVVEVLMMVVDGDDVVARSDVDGGDDVVVRGDGSDGELVSW